MRHKQSCSLYTVINLVISSGFHTGSNTNAQSDFLLTYCPVRAHTHDTFLRHFPAEIACPSISRILSLSISVHTRRIGPELIQGNKVLFLCELRIRCTWLQKSSQNIFDAVCTAYNTLNDC